MCIWWNLLWNSSAMFDGRSLWNGSRRSFCCWCRRIIRRFWKEPGFWVQEVSPSGFWCQLTFRLALSPPSSLESDPRRWRDGNTESPSPGVFSTEPGLVQVCRDPAGQTRHRVPQGSVQHHPRVAPPADPDLCPGAEAGHWAFRLILILLCRIQEPVQTQT